MILQEFVEHTAGVPSKHDALLGRVHIDAKVRDSGFAIDPKGPIVVALSLELTADVSAALPVCHAYLPMTHHCHSYSYWVHH